MGDTITIGAADGTWVVRSGDAVLGETTRALRLEETGHDPVIYFPREDIAMALLEPSATETHCPLKGDASYFSLQGESGRINDVGWSYEDPISDAQAIKGYVAFHTDKLAVEAL